MRLTLRTLLAYLDDRLPPANAKELGQKITKSPFATELVDRIREVKRRRRLAMPEKPVAMIDANLVAEYLDDQLTPELVAKIEMEILASDVKLAEVASAHEILGLLQDPVTIDARLRDRLYAMDPSGKTDVVRALGSDTTGRAASGPSVAQSNTTAEWKPLPVVGASSRRLPFFIVGGLALLWLGIVISDSILFGPKTPPKDDTVAAANSDVPNGADELIAAADSDTPPADTADGDSAVADATTSPQPAGSNEPKVEADLVAANTNSAPEMKGSSTDSGTGTQPAATTEPGTTTEPATTKGSAAVVAAADAVATKDTDVPGATVKPPKTASPDVPVPADVERILYHLMTNNKTVFVFEESTGRWMRLDQIPGGETISTTRNNMDCASLFKQRWFAIAEPFTAQFIAENKGWNASLSGPILARTVSDSMPGLEVYSGRVKLGVESTEPWNDEVLPVFGIRTAGVNASVTLLSKDSVAGVEVIPVAASLPHDADAESNKAAALLHLDGADFRVTVTVIKGEASVLLPGVEQEALLSKGQTVSWLAVGASDSVDASAVAENVILDNGRQLAAIPAWLHEDTKPVPEAEALSNQITEALANGDDPALAMIPLLSDRNPQLGIRAVQVFSAMHDIDRLLTVVFESYDESVHRAAIDGLSQIINGSASGRRDIRYALETRLPMTEIEMTMFLLAGMTDADARDADFCRSLVEQLNNDRLATRTLAFYRIQKYSDDRLGYHPEAESSRRRDAVKRWQKFLDRNSGKLIP